MTNPKLLPARSSGNPSAWEQALYAFLVEKGNRSGSRRTVEGYGRMLWPFFASLGKTPDRVVPPDVMGWAHGIGLSGRVPSSTTIGARIACLSSYYRFLRRMELVASNPCDALERPKSVTAPARGYSAAEVRRLLAVVPDTVPGRRDRAIFWNYLSVVFSWIAETIAVERWEGTLEYTMMAPVRRWAQLLGSVSYAMVYGLIHTAVILVALILFFPQLEVTNANPMTVIAFMVLGSFSFVGIGMIAAILPLLYVERGAQMTFVLQSVLLFVSGVYYSIDVLPGWMQVLSHLSPATYVLQGVRAGLIDGAGVDTLLGDVWPLLIMGVVLIPFGLWAFGKAERYAKRTGKLKRVG